MPIYHLHTALKGITPCIWRRLEVAADTSLPELSRILLTTMGWEWEEDDPHRFTVAGAAYGDAYLDDVLDETAHTLADIAPEVGSCFHFDYGFSEERRHLVTVQAIVPPEDGAIYPRCLAGSNARPHPRCDGIADYAALLGALANAPGAEERKKLQELWVGESFDPQRFEIEKVNAALQTLIIPIHAKQSKRFTRKQTTKKKTRRTQETRKHPMERDQALAILSAHATELRHRGVLHAALFGSLARGEASIDSDIDVLIEIDPAMPIGVFEYVAIQRYIAELFPKRVDVVNRKKLKNAVRPSILKDALYAF